MKENLEQKLVNNHRPTGRFYALFLIVFFLVMTFLTAFIVIPQVNKAFEKQHILDREVTLEIETELFARFISNHREVLEGLSQFPVVTSAALLSSAENPTFIDLMDNFSIAGEKSRIIVQDIAGNIIYQTSNDISGDFNSDADWIDDLIKGKVLYNFQLIEQEGDFFRFALSIPITYLNNIEGILSAEITAPMFSIFSPKTIEEGGAFKMEQGGVIVQTKNDHILLPREIVKNIPEDSLKLSYISDDTEVLRAQYGLRNAILMALFAGLATSFVFFALFGLRAYSTQEKNTSHVIFSRIYIVPIMIFIIGIAFSISAYFILQDLKTQKIQQKILGNNKSQIVAVEKAFLSNLNVLTSLKAFFDSSTYVDRNEFQSFSQPLLKQHRSIQALEWVPKITLSERYDYEEKVTQDNFENFIISEKNSDGSLVTAKDRDVYFPVYYVEPLEENEKDLGFDLGSDTRLLDALNQARDVGKTVATARITSAQEQDKQSAILILNPVYEGGIDYRTVEERRKKFKGFVIVLLRIDDVVYEAINNSFSNNSLFIQDITEPENLEVISGYFNEASVDEALVSQSTFDIAGRQWLIKSFPNENIQNATYFTSVLAFLCGLALTLFTSYTVVQLIHRRRAIEDMVQKRTQEIEDSKYFQQLIMLNIPDLLFVKDEEFKIINANPAFLNLYPEDIRDDVIGTTTLEKYDKKEADGFLIHDRAALKDGSSETEETVLFPDGKRRTLFTKKTRFYDGKGKSFILGIARDITDMKIAEEEILRSNLELERFAYVASHDLQEPLRMITNFTELLEREYGDELGVDAKQYIDFAYNGAKRMQSLVNDLLEYSRIGQEAEKNKRVDMNNLMVLIKDNLKEAISSSGAEITYESLPTVHGNPVRLMRLMQNIVGNAIKYQRTDAKPQIKILTAKDNDMWVISIHDNGIGMKNEYCEKIFEPFKRLHGKNEYTGTGMGLAICRKIVEDFGGEIWAESNEGKGSVFYFTIPEREEV